MKKENDLIEFRVKKVGDLITRLMSYVRSKGLNVVIGSKDQFVHLKDIDNILISEDEISLEDIREATEAAASVRAEMGMGNPIEEVIRLSQESAKQLPKELKHIAELFGIELPEDCDGDCANCKIEHTKRGLIAEA